MTDTEARPALQRAPDADIHPTAPAAVSVVPFMGAAILAPASPGPATAPAVGFGTASETFALAGKASVVRDDGPKVTVKVKLSKKLHKRLRRRAADDGVSLSSLVSRLLAEEDQGTGSRAS